MGRLAYRPAPWAALVVLASFAWTAQVPGWAPDRTVEIPAAEARVLVPAVAPDGSGVPTHLVVSVEPAQAGAAGVFVATEPPAAPDFQFAAREAVLAAANATGQDVALLTALVRVEAPGATLVEGPSAGLAVGVAAASALSGAPARLDVAITGALTADGTVHPVGGVMDKVDAAAAANATAILVPPGHAMAEEPLTREVTIGPGTLVIEGPARRVDVAAYARETHRLGVHEVRTLGDALRIAVPGAAIAPAPAAGTSPGQVTASAPTRPPPGPEEVSGPERGLVVRVPGTAAVGAVAALALSAVAFAVARRR